MSDDRIAVIMACYNRKQKTLDCLDSLLHRQPEQQGKLTIYLLDDGSTDGTSEAVREKFPQVNILQGDGNCYWNGGMRIAFGAAIDKGGYDFYLWVNDDVKFYEGFLARLLSAYEELVPRYGPMQILIGAVRDPESGKLTYSGSKYMTWWHPLKFEDVPPDPHKSVPCDAIVGNCVLIPAEVVQKIGNLSDAYTHAMGDTDYGVRARRAGARLWVAPGYAGDCEDNRKRIRWLEDPELPFKKRMKLLNSHHGLPFREYVHLVKEASPLLWPLFMFLPYVKAVGIGVRSKLHIARD